MGPDYVKPKQDFVVNNFDRQFPQKVKEIEEGPPSKDAESALSKLN